jgi:ribosomal protein L16/L10AE
MGMKAVKGSSEGWIDEIDPGYQVFTIWCLHEEGILLGE